MQLLIIYMIIIIIIFSKTFLNMKNENWMINLMGLGLQYTDI
jgi:hypothetical protein